MFDMIKNIEGVLEQKWTLFVDDEDVPGLVFNTFNEVLHFLKHNYPMDNTYHIVSTLGDDLKVCPKYIVSL